MAFYQKSNSIGSRRCDYARYSGVSISLHFHKYPEAILTVKGKCRLFLKKREEAVLEGMCALVFPNEIHGVELDSDSEIYVAVFSEKYVPEFSDYIKGKSSIRSSFTASSSTVSAFGRLFPEKSTPYTDISRSAAFYGICEDFLSKTPLVDSETKESMLTHKILSYISDNCLADISLESMADNLGYDKNYLSRVLHKSLGIGFCETVNHCRCEHAAMLLKTTELSITEIAFECGFGTARSFDRVFLKSHGLSPREFRKKLSNQDKHKGRPN